MSDVLSEITLNGETTRVMKIGGGPGEWEGTIDDFAGGMPASGQLLLSMRHVWTSPASNPVSNPDFFIGLCAAGKPYASGSSHAYGTRMFYSSFQKDPFTFTDNGFYTFMFPWKSENGVQAGLGSGYSFWMNRYEIAAGTQPFGCIMQDLGTGNWLWQPITHDGAYNAVDLSQTELESGRIARTHLWHRSPV